MIANSAVAVGQFPLADSYAHRYSLRKTHLGYPGAADIDKKDTSDHDQWKWEDRTPLLLGVGIPPTECGLDLAGQAKQTRMQKAWTVVSSLVPCTRRRFRPTP